VDVDYIIIGDCCSTKYASIPKQSHHLSTSCIASDQIPITQTMHNAYEKLITVDKLSRILKGRVFKKRSRERVL
jgi:hypothetical protein